MVFWNVHTCHQNITLQEIAVNAILTKKEWESMPTGLFDQVRNFEKSIFAKQCFYCICILNTGNLSDDQGRNYNCVQACLASLLVSWNHHPEYHYCLIIICAYCILHVQCHYQLELCQLNVCRLKGCNSEMEKHWDM